MPSDDHAFPIDGQLHHTVCVHLFAGAAQAAGTRQVIVKLPVNSTIAELAAAVSEQYPPLQSLLAFSRWAIGSEFVSFEHVIAPEEQRPIAMIPPVSGG